MCARVSSAHRGHVREKRNAEDADPMPRRGTTWHESQPGIHHGGTEALREYGGAIGHPFGGGAERALKGLPGAAAEGRSSSAGSGAAGPDGLAESKNRGLRASASSAFRFSTQPSAADPGWRSRGRRIEAFNLRPPAAPSHAATPRVDRDARSAAGPARAGGPRPPGADGGCGCGLHPSPW